MELIGFLDLPPLWRMRAPFNPKLAPSGILGTLLYLYIFFGLVVNMIIVSA
jgi:hypothetical protein